MEKLGADGRVDCNGKSRGEGALHSDLVPGLGLRCSMQSICAAFYSVALPVLKAIFHVPAWSNRRLVGGQTDTINHQSFSSQGNGVHGNCRSSGLPSLLQSDKFKFRRILVVLVDAWS